MTVERLRPRILAIFGALAALLLVGVAAPASAHDELVGSDPVADAVVETLPDALTLTFSGVLLAGDGATEVVVTDASGTDLTAGEPVLDGVRVSQPLSGDASGTVEVAWRVVSSDGHPISGEFAFSVGAPSSPGDGETPAPPSPSEGAGDGLLPVWIGIGVIAVAGAVVAFAVTRRRPSRED
ncbi:MAG: copper resistance protein CopC [Candidatus Microbacterium phytovorans]|uniref:Copper resistance protein CopC n=1 Tax=Candidatus Microbacterium phytovorans TaxID=3121374 RepID=A0AAJ5W3H9_9MICO|nr:copper resistance CopC family protein [Microbacterium sp.]WEK14128.1 MAG: copper resistance protein CopC [Microbacterium sp.]